MNYPVVYRKKSLKERVRRRVALILIALGWDIHSDAFDDFACDNDYGYCPDCQGFRSR